MGVLKELNEKVSLMSQLKSSEEGPVVLINVFTVDVSEEVELVKAWTHDAAFMKEQPGYISTQLHKGIAGSSNFINYAVWENVESFRTAFANPEFQKRIGEYPNSAVTSPHLFKKIAVKGHCVG